MIYDCFPFYNELELLEVRLHELADVVDKFVLVESTRTFTNLPKPLHYWANRSRFDKFNSRIIHVIVEDSPNSSDAWLVDHFQKDCIARGLTHCQPNDLILISDLDEIPRAEAVARAAREFKFPQGVWADYFLRPVLRLFTAWSFSRGRVRRNHPYTLKFQQSLHRQFINCVTVGPPKMVHWYGTRMLYYRDFTTSTFVRYSGYKIVENGGWHFTSMGGTERIVQKIKSFTHQEYNTPEFLDANRIEKVINCGQSLFEPSEELRFTPLDKSYPRYVLENPQKFEGWIKNI